jgi:hypothetical protein
LPKLKLHLFQFAFEDLYDDELLCTDEFGGLGLAAIQRLGDSVTELFNPQPDSQVLRKMVVGIFQRSRLESPIVDSARRLAIASCHAGRESQQWLAC